jgi:hypothetical protein
VTTTDPVASAAARAYVQQSAVFGEDTNLIVAAEIDAFLAGVEWARGHQENQ